PLLEDMPVEPTVALPVPLNGLAIISSTPLAPVRRPMTFLVKHPMTFLVKHMPLKALARGNGTPVPARKSGAPCASPRATPRGVTDTRRRAKSECSFTPYVNG